MVEMKEMAGMPGQVRVVEMVGTNGNQMGGLNGTEMVGINGMEVGDGTANSRIT